MVGDRVDYNAFKDKPIQYFYRPKSKWHKDLKQRKA